MAKKINIKDIAKESGFSMMTVSRALSNPEKVSKSKRDKIEKIIKKSYTCNSLYVLLARNGYNVYNIVCTYI